MQNNNDADTPTDQDFDYLKEALKIENLTCDYYHNLVVNQKIEKLIENYLTESLAKKLNKNSLQNQFYIACFWGYREVVKTLISTYPDLDVNHINGGSKWTPLHAATFMENGPIVMILLDKGAEVDSVDKYGRSPIDFASASEIIWPHFAARKCKRLNKTELTDKQIFSKTQIVNRMNGFTQGRNQIKFAPYQVSKNDLVVNDNFNIAYANGDVLANSNNNSAMDELISSLPSSSSSSATNSQAKQTNFNLW